jgi:hypothetical protein
LELLREAYETLPVVTRDLAKAFRISVGCCNALVQGCSRGYPMRRGGPARPLVGQENGAAKLNAAQVAEIRRRLALGETGAALAREFRVSDGTVSMMRRGQSWRRPEGWRSPEGHKPRDTGGEG